MYHHILIPLENSPADETILMHIKPLARITRDLTGEGFSCEAVLALGEPSDEIVKLAREKNVDLIAMTTHGHRLISDILYGATADKVRHAVDVPVLLLKVRT
jgi:nucleotide-binding universal stress UspA family protein